MNTENKSNMIYTIMDIEFKLKNITISKYHNNVQPAWYSPFDHF